MLAVGKVHRSPSPAPTISAVAPLELAQRRLECAGDDDIARLPLRRRAVVAPVPARGVALQESRQRQRSGGEEALEGAAEVVAVDRPYRLALPGDEDQRLGELGAHGGIPALQTIEGSLVRTARPPSGGDHQRLELRKGEREHIGLGRTHAGNVVAIAVKYQLFDAF